MINNEEYAKQLVKFNGLEFNNISPTDLDAFMEFDNKLFIFIETKYKDAEVPLGQRLAFERTCDALAKAGKISYIFVARHAVPKEKPIMLASCIVTDVRYKGKWVKTSNGFTIVGAVTKALQDHKMYKYASPVKDDEF